MVTTSDATTHSATHGTDRKFTVDRQASSTYDEAIYRAARVAEPLASFDDVDDAAIERYERTGYLAIARAFDPDLIESAKAALMDLVAGRNPAFNGVQYGSLPEGEDFADLSEERRLDLVRRLMAFCKFDERLRAVMEDAALAKLLSRLLGGVPRCFQEMALLKPPGGGREKPWHQDKAYFDYPFDTPVVGAWIALDRAGLDNGCMHVVEGSHREPVPHFQIRDWQVCDTHLAGKEIVAVPLPPVGMMLFLRAAGARHADEPQHRPPPGAAVSLPARGSREGGGGEAPGRVRRGGPRRRVLTIYI